MKPLATLALTDEEQSRARRVAQVASRADGGLDELVSLLDDPSWAVRRAVVAALAGIGPRAAVRLCEVLTGGRQNEARLAAAVDALVICKGDVDELLLRVADSRVPAVVCDAAQVLGRRRSTAAVPRLAALTASDDDNVALAAIEALGRINDDTALAPLIAAVEGHNFFRAFPAIDVLGRSGSARAVKPLLKRLGDPQYAIEAARALGRVGDSSAAPALISLLGRSSDALVRAAAAALAEIQDRQAERFGAASSLGTPLEGEEARKATHRLVQCLGHADPNEQAALVRVLSWVGGEGAATALVDLLAADHAGAQVAAAALSKLGRAAEPHLLGALRNADSDQRLMILPLLSHRTEVALPVADCLADRSPNVRVLACDALARIGEVSVVPELFGLLSDPDARVTQSAVAAIQSLGSNQTERLALEAARSADSRVRRAAIRIIAYFGYKSAIGILLEGMHDEDERIRDTAIFGLAYLDDSRAIEALLDATTHASAKTRAAGMRALGQVAAEPRTLTALRAGLHDPDGWARYFACQSLSRLKDEASADAISSLLADPAGQVRVAVVEALAQLRGRGALDALHRAAVSDDADVQRAALLGLGHVKDVASLPLLRRALERGDPATRLVAVSALAEYDAADVAHDLGAALADGDESVRGAAVSLLAARSGPEATRALVAQLGNRSLQPRIVAALAQPAEGRIELLAETLKSASPDTAALIVSALVRAQRSEARLALEEAFSTPDVVVRRAIAPALAIMGTSASLSLLARAALEDPDEEVRAISVAAAARE